jgi:arginyl-tRNA synthetase
LYRYLERRLAERIRDFLHVRYGLELGKFSIEQPPRLELGEYALPVAFELAKKLRQPPRTIAQEIIRGVSPIAGFRALEVAGAGYINAHVDRAEFALAVARDDEEVGGDRDHGKILVEHSSINPNKAAHVGHLRNAILGDTFVRLLRYAGHMVDVQNYIDNTGVQVADVVVGFLFLEKRTRLEIEKLAHEPRFDHYCWDLYARVSAWYGEDRANQQIRLEVLDKIEQGGNETAEVADLISTAVLRRHLETMERLDIEYDFLPRESEILHLRFWEAAFGKMRDAGVLFLETQGKNKGCWVMRRGGTVRTQTVDGAVAAEQELSEEDQKVIVRSNGTVGYIGKDIAYHLWKFGLLGRDFGYQEFFRYPRGHQCWISAERGQPEHPHFGGVRQIYNVIDSRQAEAQNTVIEALGALGYREQAEHYTHFSYEMVALTPRCATELGYRLSEEEKARAYIEVSGRRGFGVKADDLLDTLLESAKREVDSRHGQLSASERHQIARLISIGALRYFMLKYTKSSVIAFDFKEALSFEGETGPYAQYAVVRATNIFRKGGMDAEAFASELVRNLAREELEPFLAPAAGNEMWELWLAASKTAYVVEQSISATEPAYLGKHVFQLAQSFNTFYHRHPILAESDAAKRKFLLATAAIVRRELVRALAMMGISVPPVM